MDFIDRVRELSQKAQKAREQVQTEEATKNALVMPFINNVLEYNVFDPTEVVPELTADVGIKKGEKVDYALLKEGKPLILFECKSVGTDLSKEQASQLYRYFSATEARFGVLTDGIVYRFYSDLEQPNLMDAKPFFEFNLLDFEESHVEELKKFSKSSFNLDAIRTTASELKYTKEIEKMLAEEWTAPSEDFVRFLVSRVYSGHKTQAVIQQFTPMAKLAFQQFISGRIKDRLRSALAVETASLDDAQQQPATPQPKSATPTSDITTTIEELQAYYIVKSMLREVVDPKRIIMRDAKSYCAILLDDNNRKPICRLYLDSVRKQVGLFDERKNEERVSIEHLDDIYTYAEKLKATPAYYART